MGVKAKGNVAGGKNDKGMEEFEMAQFLLLLHADPTEWLKMPAEEKQKWFGKYMAWEIGRAHV